MKTRLIGTVALLTTVLCCGCAGGPLRKDDKVMADLHCEAKQVGAHCITGEELQRYGGRDTAEALRMAFPWIN